MKARVVILQACLYVVATYYHFACPPAPKPPEWRGLASSLERWERKNEAYARRAERGELVPVAELLRANSRAWGATARYLEAQSE